MVGAERLAGETPASADISGLPAERVRPSPVAALAAGVLLVAVAGGLFFFDLGAYPLLDPDEARHAEVARELAEARGLRRLFLPTLHLRPYTEKPAGYYWLVALAYGVGGVEAGTARAVSATAGLLAVLALYAWAVPRVGVAGALAAGLVLATCGGWIGLARISTLDMTLTALVTGGVLAGLAWLERPPPRRRLLAPYVLAALGALVKGPLAFVLVGGPLALAAARRPRPALAELGILRGVAVATAIVAALYLPVALLDLDYLRDFLWTNVRRFDTDAPHAAALWYYLVWLPVLLLPWTPLAVPALARAGRDPSRRTLLLWAAFVPAFLTLASGKLATYALPALPPLALLVGPELARGLGSDGPPADARAVRIAAWTTAALLAGLAVATVVATVRLPMSWSGTLALVLAGGAWAAALAVAAARDRPALVPAAMLGAALTLYPLAARVVLPAVAQIYSDRDFARAITAADAGAPVITFAAHAPSLVFYLRRPVLHTEDEKLIRELFDRDEPVFLVAGHRHWENLERLLGARAHVWAGHARRRLYGNRPPP